MYTEFYIPGQQIMNNSPCNQNARATHTFSSLGKTQDTMSVAGNYRIQNYTYLLGNKKKKRFSIRSKKFNKYNFRNLNFLRLNK